MVGVVGDLNCIRLKYMLETTNYVYIIKWSCYLVGSNFHNGRNYKICPFFHKKLRIPRSRRIFNLSLIQKSFVNTGPGHVQWTYFSENPARLSTWYRGIVESMLTIWLIPVLFQSLFTLFRTAFRQDGGQVQVHVHVVYRLDKRIDTLALFCKKLTTYPNAVLLYEL